MFTGNNTLGVRVKGMGYARTPRESYEKSLDLWLTVPAGWKRLVSKARLAVEE